MCNSPTCSHVDSLNDDIDDIFGGFDREAASADQIARKGDLSELILNRMYVENCPVCRGSGVFRSWAGRIVGPCRRCGGRGKQTFKTSPEARAATKAAYHRRQDQKAQDARDAAETWRGEFPAEYEWLRRSTSNFARSLLQALDKYGRLTDGQINAVRKILAQDEQRNADRAQQRQNAIANAVSVDIEPIEKAFAQAQSKGIKRPKMRLDTFKFSLAPAHGANAGAVYVVEGDIYLGKIKDGKFIRSRDCTAELEARIVAVASNPSAAATAYGQRTGQCSICGRELTKGESIDRAVGPICWEKYFG